MHYHLTINTGIVGFDTAADMVFECVKALKSGAKVAELATSG